MREKVAALVKKYEALVIDYRRDIHVHPELGYQETRTANKVAEILENLGLEVQTGVGKTGVVGLLRGNKPGKTIALRADMDALPLTEQTGLPYASQNPGIMHACGHDMHTAMLLGAAHVLVDLKQEIEGNIKFVFQPAEENNPDGGAKRMIADGVLENPTVDAIVGMHVWPLLPNHHIGIRKGAITAASDSIKITVKGKSAHGSAPDEGVDACMMAAYTMTALQSIVARNISPLDAAVVTIGTIHGGYRNNVIADEVVLEGTVRTINPAVRAKMPKIIEKIVGGIVEGMGGTYELQYNHGYPITLNDDEATEKVIKSIIGSVGEKYYVPVEKPSLGGEDFSFYAKKIPGVYMWLGCRPADIPIESFAPVHNPKFAPDESTMATGVKVMVNTALDLLKDQQ